MFIKSAKIVRAAFVGAMLAAGCFALSAQTHADSIRWAIIYQLNEWPESEYRDIYKNFMQDRFGPGHILKDKKAAEAYPFLAPSSKRRFSRSSLFRNKLRTRFLFFRNEFHVAAGVYAITG